MNSRHTYERNARRSSSDDDALGQPNNATDLRTFFRLVTVCLSTMILLAIAVLVLTAK